MRREEEISIRSVHVCAKRNHQKGSEGGERWVDQFIGTAENAWSRVRGCRQEDDRKEERSTTRGE